MHTLRVRNVQQAYVQGLALIREHGVLEETRNGPALVVPDPVVTTYERPWERVLLDPSRDANPFFHLMEAMWMLAGRRDVASIARYNSGIARYSNDGETFHGAYGHRWRRHFPVGEMQENRCDQLIKIIELLRRNPADRRIVLQMWDPTYDLGEEGADFPCNTQVYFRRRQTGAVDVLDMTVCCRSNDAIWGAYGANAVHFSVLHEFVSACVGMGQGRHHQLSNNLHAYSGTLEKVGEPCWPVTWARGGAQYRYTRGTPLGQYMDSQTDEYSAREVRHEPLFNPIYGDPAAALRQIEVFWDGSDDMATGTALTSGALGDLIMMRAGWRAFKSGDRDGARQAVSSIQANDWRRACSEWLERRYSREEAR